MRGLASTLLLAAVSCSAARALPVTEPAAEVWASEALTWEGGAERPATLRELRTARHEGFDRMVLEFEEGPLPGYQVSLLTGTARTCGSDQEVSVAGEARLELRVSPAQAHDEAGEVTIAERDRVLDLPAMKQLVITCDFEGVLTVVLGVARGPAFRVTRLSEPERLVVDVRH